MTLDDILKHDKIWPHQLECIIQNIGYIEKFNSSKCDIGGALNRLPTGTGKSGIITVLSRCVGDVSRVLVLTPSIALREQLCEDIEYDFFDTIKIDNRYFHKEVKTFRPKDIDEKIDFFELHNSIFISTIESLYDIFKNKKTIYDRICNAVDLVIFDEGHREPAPEWARAVRSIPKPRILFTATPYRNDRKKFNINESFIYAFTHESALKSNYIRNVEFRCLDSLSIRPEEFVNQIVSFYKNELLKIAPQNIGKPRIIIHCNNYEEIRDIVYGLANLGYSAIGIHDRFKGKLKKELIRDNASFINKVPNIKQKRKKYIKNNDTDGLERFNNELPCFWVHQYKLLEGIDEFSFCTVANFAPMTNARMLIQQVGRVIRNRNQVKNTAYIFTQQGSADISFWKGYLKYETKYEDPSAMEMIYYQEIFDSFTHVLPDYHYEGKKFRTKFHWYKSKDIDGNLIDKHFMYSEHINFMLSCNVYYKSNVYSLTDIDFAIRKEWILKDYDLRIEKSEFPFEDFLLIPYIKVYDSPFLNDLYLLNFRFSYTVCRLTDSYLYFYDSNNTVSDFINQNFSPLHPQELNKLFPNQEAIIQNVTLRSTDIGNHIIRRKEITALSLNSSVADLVDYMNFYSTAKGKAVTDTHNAQMYVGFTRSRISELTSSKKNINDYYEWLDEIQTSLQNADKEGSTFFNRYAEYILPPKDTSPINILIDFDEIKGHFLNRVTKKKLSIDLTCHDISDGKFNLEVIYEDDNKHEYEIDIYYDKERKKYYLESESLKKDFSYIDADGETNNNESFIRYLNREQCFRIIPNEPGIIYAHSQFYQPRLSVVNPKQLDSIELFSIFYPIPQLNDVHSEKGKICSAETWEEKSLFYIVDNLGNSSDLNQYLNDFDYLICDDAGDNEICDFIGLKIDPPKLVMIHCKAFPQERKRSASALQVVFSQAIKNLSYMVVHNTSNPPNSNKWNQLWSTADVEGTLPRVRYYKGTKSSRKIAYNNKELQDLYNQINHNVATVKEVYIILGSGFSLDSFKKNIISKNPDSVNIQIAYLVQSTWSNIRKVASDFKIFCSKETDSVK